MEMIRSNAETRHSHVSTREPLADVPAPRAPRLRLVPHAKMASYPEDRELVVGLAAGESWAANAVWNKHAPMVFRLLHRALGPEGEVEDLTQEVFLRVFSKIRLLRDSNAFQSFIFSVAVRTLRWELRRRRVRRILQLSTFGELPEPAVNALDPESREALRRFYAILETLAPGDRMAFVLRHIEGLKLEEVRVALGVSLATARRRIDRALLAVMARVEQDPALAPYAAPRRAVNGD